MNKSYILGAIAILVISGFGYKSFMPRDEEYMMAKEESAMQATIVSSTTDEQAMMKDKTMTATEEAMVATDTMVKSDTMMAKSGSYLPYDSAKLAMAKAGHVVLFFHASWCPTCRALDNDITNNIKNIPANLTVLDVDYDNSTELKKKYGVTYQHTLVEVDAQGNMIKKWAGSPTLSALVSEVK